MTMKKFLYPASILVFLLGLTAAPSVFAIGSGAGGSADPGRAAQIAPLPIMP